MKKSRIIILLAVLIFMGVSVAYSSIVIPNKLEYTQEELRNLYLRYNITENDIKFAKGELPNFLEGTALHDNTTTRGISANEARAIEEDARKRIEKYGVDPANPKLDEIGGILIPVGEARKLVTIGRLIPWE